MKKICCLLVSLLLLFSLAACGEGAKPEDVVSQYLAAAKKFDAEGMQKCMDPSLPLIDNFGDLSGLSADFLGVFKSCSEKVEFKVKDVREEEGTAWVTVSFHYPDRSSLMTSAMRDYTQQAMVSLLSGGDLSEEAMLQMLTDILKEKQATFQDTYLDTEISFECTQPDGKWYVWSADPEIANIMTGNMLTAFEEMSNR